MHDEGQNGMTMPEVLHGLVTPGISLRDAPGLLVGECPEGTPRKLVTALRSAPGGKLQNVFPHGGMGQMRKVELAMWLMLPCAQAVTLADAVEAAIARAPDAAPILADRATQQVRRKAAARLFPGAPYL
ncbi:hypothetical protein [Sediminicoccus sp. KRV36]|uniref:hypothetical protein n=1 Tax=Sediminicoccus sp. KRV36 TaxID=3133721 RepID=UPI00200E54F6|nr:hypothetical protein [Sediminicoccus rosea]UPY38926.1 hypothetical protein LHU95_09580 [Sediminicoccus rosea]